MFQYCFIYFFIFVLHTQVVYGLLQETRTTEEKHLSDRVPRGICESMFCSCANFSKLIHVTCLSSGGNDSHKLEFHDFDTDFDLDKKMFLGLNIHSLTLNITNITVSKRFLEGIIALSVFNVEQSGIEVMYIYIFYICCFCILYTSTACKSV